MSVEEDLRPKFKSLFDQAGLQITLKLLIEWIETRTYNNPLWLCVLRFSNWLYRKRYFFGD